MKPTYKLLSLLTALLVPAWAAAQAPELSADEPIAYTADDGILIATGNAVYQDEDTRVEADLIRYDRNRNRIEASGNVRVTRKGLRLLTSDLSYDATARSFRAGRFRAGYPPLFMEGESFEGTLDEIDFSRVSIYFREPVDNSPKLEVESGHWASGESVSGEGLRLRTIGGIGIPLPRFEYTFGAPTADADFRLGFRNNLGGFAQARILFPLSASLSVGGNFDIFTKRGLMVGPAVEWSGADGRMRAFLDTGWIHDHAFDERGVDFLGQPIEQGRGFASFGFMARNADASVQFQSRGTYLSDSEVLRDFRREDYFENFQPDHFADFTWQQGNLLVNAFARRQINDGYGMVDRLPELRAEWLPRELAKTGLYLQAPPGPAARERPRIPTSTALTVQPP